MKLVIIVCQLGLILRTDAKIPDACSASDTNRPKEHSDITVVCGTKHIDVSIYLCAMYHALYNESMMVLNNQRNSPECFGTADWSVKPPVLKFSLPIKEGSLSTCGNNITTTTEVGSGPFSDYSKVQYITISGTVTSIDSSAGTITYREKILYKFSCQYPMQYLVNSTKVSVSGVTVVVRDKNGTFISTLSMDLYKDEQHQEELTIPKTGLDQKTRIYAVVRATNLAGRFNVLLDRCFATPTPLPILSDDHELFGRCKRDAQTTVPLNGKSQQAHFSFETFRFVVHKNESVSTFYLHCATRLCEVSTCSSLLPNCGSSSGRRRRKAQTYVSDSTTVTSPAILVRKPSSKDLEAPAAKDQAYVADNAADILSDTLVGKLNKDETAGLNNTDVSLLSCCNSPVISLIVCHVILTVWFSI